MTESDFMELNLSSGDYIRIDTISGSSHDGAYGGNYNNSTLEFDFDNHTTGRQEIVCLTDLHAIIKKV